VGGGGSPLAQEGKYQGRKKPVTIDDDDDNNNNNISYLSGPWILDTSSLRETRPRFWNNDPA
jgi:hypothetical protein